MVSDRGFYIKMELVNAPLVIGSAPRAQIGEDARLSAKLTRFGSSPDIRPTIQTVSRGAQPLTSANNLAILLQSILRPMQFARVSAR